MDISRVYYLGETGAPAFRVEIDFTIEQALAVLRGEKRPTAPVQATWTMGSRRPLDFVRTTLGIPIIVSDKVVSILDKHEFRGWATYPIALHGRDDEPIDGYHGLAVPGRCGRLQPERSREVMTQRPAGYMEIAYMGLYFDESGWDGSHLFMPSNETAVVFVMQEVRDALQAAGAKGMTFKPMAECERRPTS